MLNLSVTYERSGADSDARYSFDIRDLRREARAAQRVGCQAPTGRSRVPQGEHENAGLGHRSSAGVHVEYILLTLIMVQCKRTPDFFLIFALAFISA